METEYGIRQPRRVPAGAIGMIVLIAAIEAILAGHELDVVTAEDWQYLQAGRDAASRTRRCDLLILGDSLAKFGVLPNVVGSRTGSRAYNLAIGGGQAPSSFELLRRAYQGGARPRAVVVDFSPYLIALPPRIAREHLPFLLGYSASLQLAWKARDPVLLANLVTRRTFFSLRCRPGLRSWVASTLAGRPGRDRAVMAETRRHWGQHAGAMVMPAVPGQRVVGTLQQRRFYPKGWTPDRVNSDYIRGLIELAGAHGSKVYWLIPPIHPAVEEANEAAGFDQRYVAFVSEQQRRYPGLVVIDGRHARYDPNVFFDADHLGREGAFALSEDLGDVLRSASRSRSPDRWVKLPRYRSRTTDPSLIAARPDVFLR
jgi:hypothetical protein